MSDFLRITIHDDSQALTLQLEGRLAGASVQVLQDCWQNTLASLRAPVRVDLTGVTSIDEAGQACLTDMHRHGAKFIAADTLTKGVVAEITGEAPTARDTSNQPRDKNHEQTDE